MVLVKCFSFWVGELAPHCPPSFTVALLKVEKTGPFPHMNVEFWVFAFEMTLEKNKGWGM